jgi:predicted MPP superfamily phosphohydrolase
LLSRKEDAISFFGIILTSLVTALHLYVFARLASLPQLRRGNGLKVLAITGGALWVFFFLGRIFHNQESGMFLELLELLGMQWMGILFLLAVPLLGSELITGFGFLLSQKITLHIRTAALGLGALLVLIAHIQGLRSPAVEQYQIPVHHLPAQADGTTVAVLSDLHIGEMLLDASWLHDRVQQVQALKPDCIVLVGDLFSRNGYPVLLSQALRQLSAPLGVFAVRGNHDALRPDRPDTTGEILADSGIRLLNNEWVKINEGLILAGINDLTTARRRGEDGQKNLNSALANRPAGATILLSHTPWLVEQAATAGVDLMLSGHTHNGQIWPFNYLTRTRYPFLGGQYLVKGMELFVSRGTGTWGPRMRLWQRGEIALITLRSPSQQSSKETNALL